MPEAPEAKRAAYNLNQIIAGMIITNIILKESAKYLGFEQLIMPLYVVDVTCYGKKPLVHIADATNRNYILVISLGTSDKLTFEEYKHSNIGFQLSTYKGVIKHATHDELMSLPAEKTLYFDDQRHFGRIKAVPLEQLKIELGSLGPDLLAAALSDWISLEDWMAIYKQKKTAKWQICQALMKQELVAGIGNYLKCDILYASKILPQRLVADISDEEWETLRINAHEIIRYSYECNSNGKYVKLIYNKKITPCGQDVNTGKTKDGRGSFWAPTVQI